MFVSVHIASEYQNWILLYCLPVLKDILPEQYYTHLRKLVLALSILLGVEIDAVLLQCADTYITSFCKDMEHLYGNLITSMGLG